MRFSSDMPEIVSENQSLAMHTWFGLGGPARWFARPRTVEELGMLVQRCGDEGVSRYLLGLGANLLVCDDGVDGLVIRLSESAFRRVAWGTCAVGQDEVMLVAAAGTDMNRLALDAVRRGLSGLECMAGIPGTLGGIIRMNAGGQFGQIADVVRDVTIVDHYGEVRRLSCDEVGFRYRHSDLGDAVVCEATLALRPDDPERLRERFLAMWDSKKRSQPLSDSSAGCIFRNPPGHRAGRLIDRAGLKGRSVGGAYVSPCHANFVVVKEGATSRDVLALIGLIRREVAARFGVELELEIEVWGYRRARSAESIARAKAFRPAKPVHLTSECCHDTPGGSCLPTESGVSEDGASAQDHGAFRRARLRT